MRGGFKDLPRSHGCHVFAPKSLVTCLGNLGPSRCHESLFSAEAIRRQTAPDVGSQGGIPSISALLLESEAFSSPFNTRTKNLDSMGRLLKRDH